MLLLFHILIAIFSVIYSTILVVAPTRRRLYALYMFIATTLISGTYLVVSTKAAILASCTTGLLYIGFVSVGVAAAHRKLNRERDS